MSFGDPHGQFEWVLEEPEALHIIKACYDVGINFYDTADNYSAGASGKILGRAIKKYNLPRDNLVIATKVWFPVAHRIGDDWPHPLAMSHEGINKATSTRTG